MTEQIKLRNNGRTDSNIYYPRLQFNKRGEIVLSLYKDGSLTTGIMVGKTPESKSTLSIGQILNDWEVCGLLEDYDGEIQVSFINKVPAEAFEEIIGRGHGGVVTQRRMLLQKKENLSEAEEILKSELTKKIDLLNSERDEIVERFSNRLQIKGDKERLQVINSELY